MQETSLPPHLSVVIPAYNEESRLSGSLSSIQRYLEARNYTFEILVIDDGSTDHTSDMCREFASTNQRFRLVKLPQNGGKGYAVREGVFHSIGKYVLMCDADLATPIEELDGFWQAIEEGADVVIASRALPESCLEKRQPFYRELAGRTFNLAVQLFAVPGIHDTQCGFKLFTRKSADGIFQSCTLNGFSFDIEVLYLAGRFGFRIAEMPVHWFHRPGSKVHVLRDGLQMLGDLARIRLRHRKSMRYSP